MYSFYQYVIGAMENKPKIYGTEVTMNVWHPVIEGFNEFSLGQIWLSSGSYNDSDLNSIEAGWQVCLIKTNNITTNYL